ncbi:MAG: rhodanese-like domain-containing protein [Acidimicrobiia bacterium]|nr:rhodanese-like domain-containing protein [Acidimicrobiia bacterium]MBT8215878.1 rhodanese-like domain-containing protein [Acidimicrobiia bacterium]NNF09194.1 rhodanese-like domain-containing protein [Acidimicrobiia bacterium]NNL71117.1 rhodanese-like domain-containing protein [Acidimicrobiia bacterium]
MRRRRALAVAVMLIALAGCGSSTSAIELVTAQEAAATLQDNTPEIVLDVRTPEEFAEGHIAGAVNVDYYAADFSSQLEALDPDASYVLYCRSGNRSAETAKLMTDLEFTSVDEIDGGILAWLDAGLPLAR